MRIALRCTLSQSECCQDDSVNCSCFRKDKMKLMACSINVRERVRMSTTELYLSVDNLKKKNKQQGRQRQGRDGVSGTDVNVYVMYNLSHVKTERTYTIGPVKIQMCSARHAEDKKKGSDKLSWGLDTTDTCIVHKQTIHDCATTNTDLREGRKTTKTPRRVSKREGTTSSTWIDRQT